VGYSAAEDLMLVAEEAVEIRRYVRGEARPHYERKGPRRTDSFRVGLAGTRPSRPAFRPTCNGFRTACKSGNRPQPYSPYESGSIGGTHRRRSGPCHRRRARERTESDVQSGRGSKRSALTRDADRSSRGLQPRYRSRPRIRVQTLARRRPRRQSRAQLRT